MCGSGTAIQYILYSGEVVMCAFKALSKLYNLFFKIEPSISCNCTSLSNRLQLMCHFWTL